MDEFQKAVAQIHLELKLMPRTPNESSDDVFKRFVITKLAQLTVESNKHARLVVGVQAIRQDGTQ